MPEKRSVVLMHTYEERSHDGLERGKKLD